MPLFNREEKKRLKLIKLDEERRHYRIIKKSPKILINNKNKLVLFWSAKSGSVFMVRWFLFHMDLLEKAEQPNKLIHKYRKGMYDEEEYIKSIKRPIANLSTYHFIKLVRNPFTRAVSSYIHSLKMLNSEHPSAINLMTYSQEHELKDKYSFSDFLTRLETEDLTCCNIHWATQRHRAEREEIVKIDTLLKLESVKSNMEELELKLKLKPANLKKLSASKHHTNKGENTTKHFIGDQAFDYTIRANTPEYKYFYNKELLEKVRILYKEDFDAYDYSTEF